MNSLDLVQVARSSIETGQRPSEACLRRATSTAYYALFHCLAKEGADLLIGGTGSTRSKPAWAQTYRALEHGYAKSQCNDKNTSSFPKAIEDYANAFVTLQGKRHSADYNPLQRFSKSVVVADINLAETAIHAFKSAKTSDRRAFCAWVLFRQPKK